MGVGARLLKVPCERVWKFEVQERAGLVGRLVTLGPALCSP